MIDPLDINLFDRPEDKVQFKEAHAQFVRQKVEEGDTLQNAEDQWTLRFPNGLHDYVNHTRKLTAEGEQMLIDKINELVDIVNGGHSPTSELEEVLRKSFKK
jgi:hypothetical protein